MTQTSRATTVTFTHAAMLAVSLFAQTGCSVDREDGNGTDTPTVDAEADSPEKRPDGQGGSSGAGSVDTSLTQMEIARRVFDPSITRFAVHAYYETGAEPYTGRLGLTLNETWDITDESYTDLFAAHTARDVSIPNRLEQMQEFDDQGVQNWGIRDLIALGNSLAPPLTAGSDANVSIVFVNGLYDGNERVLGIHPTDSPFAFVFKDVVRSVGGDATTQRYVEQATVVHELGHAIGFVDNGVPMVNGHEDGEHPHHTVNTDGVMYWAVESTGGALDFVTGMIIGARRSLFGPESTLDAHNYMPSN